MEVVGTSLTVPRDQEAWSAAQELQTALFTEMFRSAGFADAFGTGEQALDALSEHVLEQIAEKVSADNPQLAEVFYSKLSVDE